jgi:hypothetical protein
VPLNAHYCTAAAVVAELQGMMGMHRHTLRNGLYVYYMYTYIVYEKIT